MSTKVISIISSLITAILVFLLAIVFGFGGIVLLNGFMDATMAVNTGFTCLGITVILCAILAGILTSIFIAKFKWSNILAVFISIFVSTLLGGGLGFASMIVMVIVADSMY